MRLADFRLGTPRPSGSRSFLAGGRILSILYLLWPQSGAPSRLGLPFPLISASLFPLVRLTTSYLLGGREFEARGLRRWIYILFHGVSIWLRIQKGTAEGRNLIWGTPELTCSLHVYAPSCKGQGYLNLPWRSREDLDSLGVSNLAFIQECPEQLF